MGQLISMVCSDCGYQSNSIQIGSTFLDDAIHGPAFDTRTSSLIEANYEELDGQQIIPYSDPRLRKAPNGAEMPGRMEWGDYELWFKYNFCPSCNGFTLEIDQSEMAMVD